MLNMTGKSLFKFRYFSLSLYLLENTFIAQKNTLERRLWMFKYYVKKYNFIN